MRGLSGLRLIAKSIRIYNHIIAIIEMVAFMIYIIVNSILIVYMSLRDIMNDKDGKD